MKDNTPAPNANQGVRIQIDKKPHESPTPTTGAAIYALAGIPQEQQLYKQVPGNDGDEPVFNTQNPLNLKNGDHFYSTAEQFKGYTIFVNTRRKVVQNNVLSYTEVLALAFETPPTGPNWVISISYRNAAGDREGTLTEGGTVTIKNGTKFDVTATDKS